MIAGHKKCFMSGQCNCSGACTSSYPCPIRSWYRPVNRTKDCLASSRAMATDRIPVGSGEAQPCKYKQRIVLACPVIMEVVLSLRTYVAFARHGAVEVEGA